ncbi:MAG: hypothetical protein GX443_11755 [Deltaproteobacteria bacterium]|nr:hypothetical protein [Deltaproteobacteria bacterium]
MIEPRFEGEPMAEKQTDEMIYAKCKCGRCTRTGESSDSSMASSDLG